MANKDWCRHYNGIPSKVCLAGIEMETVRRDRTDGQPGRNEWACLDESARHLCASWAAYTQVEIDETERKVAQFVQAMNDLSERKSDVCPHCGKSVVSMRQTGRSVYGSCGCRLWQGDVPPKWR